MTANAKSEQRTWEVKLKYGETEARIFLHFSDKQYKFAKKIIQLIKKDFPRVHRYFDYIPQSEIHFVVNSAFRTANGAAQVFPRNQVALFDFPPMGIDTLTASEDWIRVLLIHEYTHILTLEMTSGIPGAFRYILGSTVKFNQFIPIWFSEGVAVWVESKITGQGRLYHPWIRKKVAELLSEKKFCNDLSCLDSPLNLPFRQFPYWVGAMFLDFIEQEKKGSIKCIIQDNSSNIPMFLNSAFVNCTGDTAEEKFQKFLNDLKKIDHKFCPIKDQKLCANQKYNKQINWFKGYVDTDKLTAFIKNRGKKGISYEYGTEKLVIQKNGKTEEHIFDRSIEMILPSNSPDEFLFNTIIRHKGLMDREFYFYKNGINKISRNVCEYRDQNPDYILAGHKQVPWYCLKFFDSHWHVYYKKDKDIFIKKLKFDLNIIEPIIKQNQNKDVLVYRSRPSFLENSKVLSIDLNDLKKEADKKKKEKIEEKRFKKRKKYLDNIGTKVYQSWRYLDPNFLFLEYTSSGNIDALGASTSLADPMGKQSISTSIYYNFGLDSDRSPYSGGVLYSYKWGKYTFGTSYWKSISQNSFLVENVSEIKMFSISRGFKFNNHNITSSLGVSEYDENEQWYSRKLKKLYLNNKYFHYVESLKSVYRGTSFDLDLSFDQNFSNDRYWHLESKLTQFFRWGEDFQFAWSAAYGRLFHSDSTLRDGDIDGGGATSTLSSNYFFSSYVIPYGDIFGDNIFMSVIDFDHVINRPQHGDGLFPFFLKTFIFTYGFEYLSSDVIIADDTTTSSVRRDFSNNGDLTSAFVGVSFVSRLIYILPVVFDIVYAMPLSRDDLSAQLNYLVKTEYRY